MDDATCDLEQFAHGTRLPAAEASQREELDKVVPPGMTDSEELGKKEWHGIPCSDRRASRRLHPKLSHQVLQHRKGRGPSRSLESSCFTVSIAATFRCHTSSTEMRTVAWKGSSCRPRLGWQSGARDSRFWAGQVNRGRRHMWTSRERTAKITVPTCIACSGWRGHLLRGGDLVGGYTDFIAKLVFWEHERLLSLRWLYTGPHGILWIGHKRNNFAKEREKISQPGSREQ